VAQLRDAARRVTTQARSHVADQLVMRAGVRGRLPEAGTLRNQAARWISQRVEGPRQSYRVSPIEGRRSSVLFPEGDVWLSRNLHRINSRGVIDGLRKALEEGARHSETASSLAQRLRDEIGHRVSITDTGPPSFKIPEQLRAIEREAYAAIRASGDPRASQRFAATRAEFERYAKTLGTGQKGLAAPAMDALRKIEAAIRRNDVTAVDSAVKWWTWNREQEHQQLIARTELTRAYSHAYVRASEGIAWIPAFEWVANADACDECAALDGTIMPRGEVLYPCTDTHPGCECILVEVVDSDLEPSESEWSEMMADEAA
jgi:hypothetical protein